MAQELPLQKRIERDLDGSESRQPEHDLHNLDPVLGEGGDAIALGDAAGGQPRGDDVGTLVELGKCEGMTADRDDALRMLLRA